MAIMSQLLSKIKPKTVEQRIAQLPGLPIESLLAIIQRDEPEKLQLAAVEYLTDSASLIALATDSKSTILQQAARQRIATLIDENHIRLTDFVNRQIDTSVKLAIVGHCKTTEAVSQVLFSVDDPQFLYTLALEGMPAKVRELAAIKIDNTELLKELLKVTRGRDKLVYKIVKEKCDALRRQTQLDDTIQKDTVALCERLETHSQREFDQQFINRTKRMTDQWISLESHSLEPPAKALKHRIENAIALCQQTIDVHHRQVAQQAAKQAAKTAAKAEFDKIIDELQGLLSELYTISFDENTCENKGSNTLVRITSEHGTLISQWQKAQTLATPTPLALTIFESTSESLQQQLKQCKDWGSIGYQLTGLVALTPHLKNQISGESSETDLQQTTTKSATSITTATYKNLKAQLQSALILPATRVPKQVHDARKIISEYELQQAKLQQTEISQQRHINALLGQANQAIAKGQSRDATGIRRTLERKLAKANNLPTASLAKVAQLDEALKKLHDWKDFAVEPKQQQLINAMNVLVNSTDNPEALASKIRHLQDQWKALSKDSPNQSLWETFHQLAEKAFEPCKTFYEQQAQIRLDNIAKRRVLVEQLNDFVTEQSWDGDEADTIDWKLIEKLIGTAIKQWQGYWPIDNGANRAVQRKFDHLLDTLRRKLQTYQHKNLAKKEQLIAQVDALLDVTDKRAATEKVKLLQSQWQQVGTVARKQEQKLWRSFRSSCDAIFAQRQQQSEDFKAELNTHKDAAEALIKDLENIGLLTGQALLEARTAAMECKTKFNAIGALPKASAFLINSRFKQALTAFEKAVNQQLKAASNQLWANLFEANDLIRLAQLASDKSVADQQLKAAKVFIDSIDQWPKNGLQALQSKITKGAVSGGLEDQEEALRLLCIRAEIITDQDTPAADATLRMKYQVTRLQQGLGQHSSSSTESMRDLTFAWIATGPVETGVYKLLLARFLRLRELLL
jgi:exonuclease SbcC